MGSLRVDPPILQAPMAGYTNYAYRQMVRHYGGVGLYATEFISARGFAWLDQALKEHPDRLWGVKEEARPLAVQIWDNDPETLARVGAKLVEEYAVSVVDLNFGCPVKEVTEKAHSGSYLLRDPDVIGRIVERVVRACAPTPVTAKIRLGCTRDCVTAPHVAVAVEQAGAAALTVHGRVAEEYFTGHANWEAIASLKQHLKCIPLIGNGDIDSAAKAVEAFTRWNVDGVMIARASLGRPWLFAQAAAALRGEPIPPDPTLAEERAALRKHYDLVVERFGAEKGTLLMRKFACCYAQGRPGARAFRANMAEINTPADFHRVVVDYFPREETHSATLAVRK